MSTVHKIQSIRFEKTFLILNVDGEVFKIDLDKVSSKLAVAPDKLRNEYQISSSGYGIHWPLLDEDLSIDGLIQHATKPKVLIK